MLLITNTKPNAEKTLGLDICARCFRISKKTVKIFENIFDPFSTFYQLGFVDMIYEPPGKKAFIFLICLYTKWIGKLLRRNIFFCGILIPTGAVPITPQYMKKKRAGRTGAENKYSTFSALVLNMINDPA